MNDKPAAPEAFVQAVVNQAESTGAPATADVHVSGHDITVTAQPDGTVTETATAANPFNPPDGSGRR